MSVLLIAIGFRFDSCQQQMAEFYNFSLRQQNNCQINATLINLTAQPFINSARK